MLDRLRFEEKAFDIATRSLHFMNQTIEDYLKKVTDAGIDIDDLSCEIKGMTIKILYKCQLKSIFVFTSEIVDNGNCGYDLVVNCKHEEY